MDTSTNTLKRSFKKRLLSLVLAFACAFVLAGSVSTPAHAASYGTVKGCLTNTKNSTTPCDVYTNGKTAKLRICTFRQNGARTSGNLYVYAVADNGWSKTYSITGCNGISNSSTNLSLPSGFTHYKIYVYRRGTTGNNLRDTYYVSIDFMSNCRPYKF